MGSGRNFDGTGAENGPSSLPLPRFPCNPLILIEIEAEQCT